MPTGWPTLAELADHIGGGVDPAEAHVERAYDAAHDDALAFGVPAGTIDATTGAADAAVFVAILDLGVDHYQWRNRPSDFASQGPLARNRPRRLAALDVLTRGSVSIA